MTLTSVVILQRPGHEMSPYLAHDGQHIEPLNSDVKQRPPLHSSFPRHERLQYEYPVSFDMQLSQLSFVHGWPTGTRHTLEMGLQLFVLQSASTSHAPPTSI